MGSKRVKGGMLEQNKARKWIRRGRNMYMRIITHHFMPSEKSTFTVFCYVSKYQAKDNYTCTCSVRN